MRGPKPLIVDTCACEMCVCVCTWTGLCVAQCFLGVQAQADVPSMCRWGVAAGSCPHVVSSSTGHRTLGP